METRLTLRAFATEVGVSAAHLSDIEHDRRRPSRELLEKIAKRLHLVGGSLEGLQKLDSRIDPETQAWLSKTPAAGALLRAIRKSGEDPAKFIARVQKNRKPKGDP